jgi:hypothetical protein
MKVFKVCESDSAQDEIVQSVHSAAVFTWEDMTNYIGRREQFVCNCEPKNEAKNATEGGDIFKTFFPQELVEIIVHETNIYAEQCVTSRGRMITTSFLRMRDCTPVTVDEIYVALALFMLMGVVKMPTPRSYLSDCEAGLRVEGCFKTYHTKLSF